jgi:hypothetical protein
MAARLDHEKIKSKIGTTKRGTQFGGASLARCALYYLLQNRLYIGEIRHREHWYPGEHPGIVPRELWDRVQAQLNSNLRTHLVQAMQGLSPGQKTSSCPSSEPLAIAERMTWNNLDARSPPHVLTPQNQDLQQKKTDRGVSWPPQNVES